MGYRLKRSEQCVRTRDREGACWIGDRLLATSQGSASSGGTHGLVRNSSANDLQGYGGECRGLRWNSL